MTTWLGVSEQDLPAFLIYLAIGTLHAIRTHTVPAQTGIWTLAQPQFIEALTKRANIAQEAINVFSSADELSAIQQLLPDNFETEVDKLIERLRVALSQIQDPYWSIQWDYKALPKRKPKGRAADKRSGARSVSRTKSKKTAKQHTR